MEILIRSLIAIGIAALGLGMYRLLNQINLKRASRKRLGLEDIIPGTPAILYFTTPHCIPCKTIQRPALAELKHCYRDQIQIIKINAVDQPELADFWGVLSVPTTFIIDSQGEPRIVNHGVASAEKLLSQLEKVEGRKLLHLAESTEVHPASLATD